MRRYLWIVAVAVVSAVIAGAITFAYVQLTPHSEESPVARAYRAGVDALARSDYAHAREQLALVARFDPGYRDVQALLARAVAGSQSGVPTGAVTPPPGATIPSGVGTGVATSTPATPATWSALANLPGFARPADLSSLLPAALAGYGPPQVENSRDLAQAIFSPSSTSTIRTVTISVVDRKSPAAALSFVVDTVEKSYPVDPSEILLAPDVRAYFGTSGANFATVTWTKGAVGYQILVQTTGGNPRALRGDLRQIAKQVG